MNLTTGKKRLAGVAALAFGGSAILGACDLEQSPCDALRDAAEDLYWQIGALEEQQSGLDETSVEYDLLEVKITALEELLETKEEAIDAQCSTDGTVVPS